jgi:hypothetical protein
LDLRRETKETQHVCDGGAILADSARDLFLSQAEFANQSLIRLRFFHRIEVFALQVLNERDLQDGVISRFANQSGYFRKTRQLGRPPAPLSGDQLKEAVFKRPDYDRLNDTVLTNRDAELIEHLLVKVFSGLVGVRQNAFDVNFAQLFLFNLRTA